MPNQSSYQTLLAFDFGLKQIGVAYGQTLTGAAKGLSILKASDLEDAQTLGSTG